MRSKRVFQINEVARRIVRAGEVALKKSKEGEWAENMKMKRMNALRRMSQAVDRLTYWTLSPYAHPFSDTFRMRRWVRAWAQSVGWTDMATGVSNP